jgi:membrane protein DedA with SNARE-associated domain/rhodanese-related sulfurtransferase
MMETLLHIIETYGLWVVFVCVLMDQGGLPVPAYPPLIVTAALAVNSSESLWPILIVAILAAVAADLLWFVGGRRFGARLLRLMCRISLSPESCVGRTRRVYGRWGAPSLIVAKYVPGFAAVATTLAGETGISLRRFVAYDAIGAALWAGGAIALGAIFHEAVGAVLVELERLGQYSLLVLLALLAVFVAGKWWQRHRFLAQIRMARVLPSELSAMLESGAPAVVLDVRTLERRLQTGWIPGSVHVRDVSELQLSPDEEVFVYCDCPNDASAAVVARKLKENGFRRVRPLAGGVDAWRSAGLPLDRAM